MERLSTIGRYHTSNQPIMIAVFCANGQQAPEDELLHRMKFMLITTCETARCNRKIQLIR